MACVYKHIRKDTGEVFYVGIGKSERRAYIKNNARGQNKHWFNIVRNIGYTVEIVMTDITWEQACFVEKYLINHYGRRDLGMGTLVNFTDGGDGINGHKHSIETKKKISEDNLRPEKLKICVENMKKAHTPEAREKARLSRDYKHIGDVQKKSIIQYDIQGNIIKEWESGKDAARELNINYKGINNCLRNKSKSSAGFIWKYKN
jgi:hypothetical protein